MKPLVHWKTAAVTEYMLQCSILDYLRLRGILAWITHSPRNKPQVAGTPDIIGVCEGGRFLAIEVKTAEGRVSKEQAAFLRQVTDAGGLAFVARSLDDVIRQINGKRERRMET